jgi:hypothetical protein
MMLVRPTGHRHGVTGEVPFGGPINGYSETPPSAAATDSTGLARDIARIAVGSGGLATLDNGDGQAALAYYDPSTVSGRPHVGTPVSASCGINYSDGSV